MDKTNDLLGAVKTYLDAIYFCDVEKLDVVFHEGGEPFRCG